VCRYSFLRTVVLVLTYTSQDGSFHCGILCRLCISKFFTYWFFPELTVLLVDVFWFYVGGAFLLLLLSLLGGRIGSVRVTKSRRRRWAGYVARMEERKGLCRILAGKPGGKRPLGRPRRRWDNIKIDL
jgi:hypothetical protein